MFGPRQDMAKRVPIRDYMTGARFSAEANEELKRAYDRMRENRVGHLPVTADRALVGILSARECALLDFLPQDVADTLKVESAMSRSIYTVEAGTPLDVVAREMSRNKYDSALIVERGAVVGVFTTTDALKALSDALTDSLPEPPVVD